MANLTSIRTLNTRFRTLPLRQRLLLYLLIPLVAGFVLLSIFGRTQVESTELRLVASRHQEIVGSITNRMTVFAQTMPNTVLGLRDSVVFEDLLEIEYQLNDPDTSPEVQWVAGRERATALNNLAREMFDLMRRVPYINAIRIFDISGEELMRAERTGQEGALQLTSPADLRNITDETYFQSAINLTESQEIYISPVIFASAIRQPIIQLATSVLRREDTALGLSIDLNAAALLDYVSEPDTLSQLRQGQNYVLVDGYDRYLADTRDPGNFSDPAYSGYLFGLNDTGSRLTLREPGLQDAITADVSGADFGDQFVTSASFSPFATDVDGTPWKLLILEESGAALADVQRFSLLFLLMTLGVMAGLAAVLWQVSNAVTRPLDEAATIADRVASGDLSARIPVRRSDEIGRLATAVNSMTGRLLTNINTLEEQFMERTRDLEVAGEIASEAVGISSASMLLNRIITLIRDRFGFYHVQVFLVNEAARHAELIASTGEAGQTLLNLNWSLPVGSQSVIGQVTARGETVIATDTGEVGTMHRPNPYLPDTRSEMALPLKSGDLVVGALDIQSTEPNAFRQEDVRIFEVLTNQLSIAMDNVRLLEESRRQVQRVQELNRRLTREAWDDFLTTHSDDLQEYYGATPARSDDAHQTPATGSLVAPIEVRGEVIGLLNAARPTGEAFGEDEIAIIRAVAERVSLAVENARLVTETQISLSETERLYQTSQAITSGATEQAILQALADNFGTANRSISLIVFGQERDANDLPLHMRRLVYGAPGMPPGDIADTTVDDEGDDERFYDIMQHTCVLPNPNAILKAYPATAAERLKPLGMQAMANFPIRAADLWMGRLVITHYAPYTFSEREQEIFGALAGQIGTVLRTNQLFEVVETERQTLESVLETMPTAILVIDAATRRVTIANEQAADLLGQQVDLLQLAAENCLVRADTLSTYPLDELPAMQALATGQTSFSEDLAILQPDGEIIDVLNNAAPILDADGNVTAVVTVFQNITELRELQSALQDTLRETTAMYESSKSIFAGQDLWGIAETTLEHVIMNIMPDVGHIILATPSGESLTDLLNVVATYPDTISPDNPYPLKTLDATNTIIIRSVPTDPRLDQADRTLLTGSGIQAMISAPLAAAGETNGWLALGFSQPQDIPPDQQRFLEALTDQAAVALQNARLKQQTEEALSQTLLLYNASREITRATTIRQILETFVSFTLPPEASQAAVLLLDGMPEERRLHAVAAWQFDGTDIVEALQVLADNLRNLLTLDVLAQDQPIIIDDVPERFLEGPALAGGLEMADLPATIALMPMVVGERMLGVVQINYAEPFMHDEGILRTYQSLVDQVASAVENRRLLEQTQTSLAETERLYHASQAIRDASSTEEALTVLQSLLLANDPLQIHVYWRQDETLTRIHYWDATGGDPSLVGQVLMTGSQQIDERLKIPPIYIDHTDDDADPLSRQYFERTGALSLASIPMQLRNRPVGRLMMGFARKQPFSRPDRDYLTAICDQTAIVLDNWQLLQQTQESLDETRVLYETSSAIADVNDARGILGAIVEHAVPPAVTSSQIVLLNGDSWDSPSATVQIAATWAHEHGPDLSGMKFTRDQYPAWQEVATPHILAIDDVISDPRLDDESRLNYTLVGTNALVVVPLESAGTPLGAMMFSSAQPRTHSPRELRIYQSLAELATISMENARLLQQTQARARQLQTSAEVSRAVTSILDIGELLPRVVDLIRDNFDYDQVQVFLIDETGEKAVLQASTGEVGQMLLGQKWSLGVNSESVIGQVTARAEPVIALDTADATVVHRPNPFLPDTRSEVAVPLISRGRVVGALDVQSNQPVAFSDEDVTVLTSLADQIAVALDNARLFEETQNYTLVLSEQVYGLQSLLEASQSFTTMLQAGDILSAAARYMVDLIRVDHCAMVMAETSGYFGRVYTEFPETGMVDQKFDLEMAWWMDAYRQSTGPIVVPDIEENDLIPEGVHDELQARHVRAIAIVPFLVTGEEIEGFIQLETFETTRTFSGEDFTLLQLLATQVATAYQNAQLFEGQQAAAEALEEQIRRLESLYATSLALTESLDTSEILTTALDGLVRTLDVDFGMVLMTDADDPSVADVVAWHGGTKPAKHQVPFAVNPYFDTLQASNMPIIVENVATSPHFVPERRQELADGGVYAMIIAPLTVQGQLIGAFSLQSLREREFSPSEITLVQTITTQVSLAYDNAELFVQAQRQAEEMGFLFNVTSAATAYDDMESSMRDATQLIGASIPNDVVAVYLMGDNGVFLEQIAQHVTTPDVNVPARIPLTTQALQPLVEDRRPMLIRDLQRQGGETSFAPGIRSLVAAPLLSGQQLVGMLAIFETAANVYDSGHQRLLQTLSSSLSAVIQNIRLLEEVRAANERLLELDRIKSQFLANMSHELRTPLNSIIGFSRVILKGIDGPLTEMQEQDLSTIHSSGQYLLNLINDILDQAKIEADKLALNIGWFDVTAVMEVARSMSVGLLKDKSVRLNMEVESDLPQVWGDEIRTRQVLINLLSNAAKFTNDGSITINAFAVQREEGLLVQISVSDTGIGIPADKLDSVFVAFEQVDGSLTRTTGGTGLGLPISKNLIEMMGGELWLESTLNVGSTFSFVIPAYERQDGTETDEVIATKAEVRPTPVTTVEAQEILPRKIVMVIDDEVGMHQLYRRYLNKAGYTVEATSNAMEAEHLVRLVKPDVIILDVRMPQRDGWDVLKNLKDSDETFAIPVIVCSIEPDTERGYQLGTSNYLIKPFLEDELLSAIRAVEAERPRERILIIDDKPETIRLISGWLRSDKRFEVLTATSGQQGLAMITQHPPDLILLDLNMPDLDGFEVLARLREDPAAARIPVVIITAEDDLEVQARERLQDTDIYNKNSLDENRLLQGVQAILALNNGDESA